MKPPRQLDGADVVHWAWSHPEPFFIMPFSTGSSPGIPIHGLAVCRYEKSGEIYRFSCGVDWEVENDSPWDTVEQAMRAPSGQYDAGAVDWQRADWTTGSESVTPFVAAPQAVSSARLALPEDFAADDTLRHLVLEGRELEAIVRLRQVRGLSLFEAYNYIRTLIVE